MSDADDLVKSVTDSEEYKELPQEAKSSFDNLLSMIVTGQVPAEQMAQMVLMTSLGVALRDNDKLNPLVEGGVWHIKGTADLVLIAGGWAWKLSLDLLGPQEVLDLDTLEPM